MQRMWLWLGWDVRVYVLSLQRSRSEGAEEVCSYNRVRRIAVLLHNIYTLYQSSQGPLVGGAERWQEAWLVSPPAVTSSSATTLDTV